MTAASKIVAGSRRARRGASRRSGRGAARIVLSNGAFDLAPRRARPLARARPDAGRPPRRRGQQRPLGSRAQGARAARSFPSGERAEIVAALASRRSRDDLRRARPSRRRSGAIRPDVHAKGRDYTAASVPERALVEALRRQGRDRGRPEGPRDLGPDRADPEGARLIDAPRSVYMRLPNWVGDLVMVTPGAPRRALVLAGGAPRRGAAPVRPAGARGPPDRRRALGPRPEGREDRIRPARLRAQAARREVRPRDLLHEQPDVRARARARAHPAARRIRRRLAQPAAHGPGAAQGPPRAGPDAALLPRPRRVPRRARGGRPLRRPRPRPRTARRRRACSRSSGSAETARSPR